MKKIFFVILLLIASAPIQPVFAQTAALQQLVLDIEKLAQLKKILTDMKTGYDIVSKGYGTVKNLTEGNFNLHEAFLNGLFMVNPRLRKYQRVADIIHYQEELLKEYKFAYREFKSSGRFSPEEITYLAKVYDNLFDRSLQNLDELTLVLTDSKLRMSDVERLSAIDRIYKAMQDKLSFLRSFNQKTKSLEQQRIQAQQNAADLKHLYNLKN